MKKDPTAPPAAPPIGFSMPCKVLRVVDGDTVDVQLVAPVIRLRLRDCWAPEVHGVEKPQGLKSAEHLQGLVDDAKQATVFIDLTGSGIVADLVTLGRVLGRLYLDGAEAAVLQCAAGHATFTKKVKP